MGVEAAAGLDRGTQQALGEDEVGEVHGLLGGEQEHDGVERAVAVEVEHGTPQVVPGTASPGGAEGAGELAAQPPGSGQALARPRDLAVERVGQVHLRPGAVGEHRDQLALGDPLDVGLGSERRQQPEAEGLAEGEEVEHAPLALVEVADAVGQQVLQRGREGRGAVPLPVAVHVHEPLSRPLTVDEVAQPQEVAARRLVQPALGLGVDGPAEHRRDEPRALVGADRLDLHPLGEPVLPDGGDGLRAGRAAADGHDEAQGVLERELVHERRRDLVEHVGVVDQQHAA